MNSVADQIIFAFLLLAMFAAGWAFCKMRMVRHGLSEYLRGINQADEIHKNHILGLREELAILRATSILLTDAELQSGLTRVRWAELLIKQLPLNHDGRNSWLLNYGTGPVFGEQPADQNLPVSKPH